MVSAGVATTTELPAAHALPDNCSGLHSNCPRHPASLSPASLRTALRVAFLLVDLSTFQCIRTFSTLTSPSLRLRACDSARTPDCCTLPAAVCARWPAEPHLMPQPPVVAKSCSNPRAHKAEVHYQRGTLIESRPCWQVVPFPCQSPSFLFTSPTKSSQSPSFPSTSPDEHHPNCKPFFQILSIPVPSISTGLKSETQVKKEKVHSSSAARCGGTWDLDPVDFFLRDF